MTYQLRVGVDLDRDGYACISARPGDGLNLVPTPVSLSGLQSTTLNATLTVVEQLTDYGRKLYRCVTDSNVNGGMYLGYEGDALDNIPVSPSTDYTMAIAVKGRANYSGVTFQIFAGDEDDLTLVQQNVSLTDEWQWFTYSFTTGAGSSFVRFSVIKLGSAALAEFDVAGLMLVEGTTAPQGFNAGNASNVYDDISSYVRDVRWGHGMTEAWQDVAPAAWAELTLDNTNGDFSPENTSSNYYGLLVPGTIIQLTAVLDGTDYTFWQGKLRVLDLSVGTTGAKTVTLRAADQTAELNQTEYSPQLRLNSTVDVALSDLFSDDDLNIVWPYFAAPYDSAEFTDFEQGVQTFAYIGDNLTRRSVSAGEVIRQLAAGEQGRFFWNARAAAWTFHNRHHDVQNTVVDDTFTGAEIEVGGTNYGVDAVVNRVKLTFSPRSLGDANTVIWSYPNLPLRLAPGEIRDDWWVTYSDPDNPHARVGARNHVTPVSGVDWSANRDEDGTGSDLTAFVGFTVDARAAKAKLRLVNNSIHDAYVQTLQFRGWPILSFGNDTITAENSDSQNAYDVYEQRVTIPLIDTEEYARAYAEALVSRFATPQPRYRSIAFVVDADNDSAFAARIFNRTIGDRIAVQTTTPAHDRDYAIVGEQHSYNASSRMHRVTFVLRPLDRVTYWMLGVVGYSELGESTRLVF